MVRRSILRFGLLSFLAYATNAHAFGHAGNSMLTTPPPRPRKAVFGLRSFTGSRYGFLWAAARLLKARDGIQITGVSSVQVYPAVSDEPGYMALALLVDSQLPVADLLTLGRELEDQLADPERPGARATLRAELLWVAGVEIKTAQIELPSADLFNQSWAIGTFAEAAEEAVKDKLQSARFYEALRHAPPPYLVDQIAFQADNPQLNRTATRDEWITTGYDWLDALADTARVMAIAQVGSEAERQGRASPIASRMVRDAASVVDSTAGGKLGHLQATASPGGSDEQLARTWAEAVQNQARAQAMRLASGVVFAAGDGLVRGLLIGAVAAEPPLPFKLLAAEVDRDPADLRAAMFVRKLPNRTRITLVLDRSLGSLHLTPDGTRGR
jgi:7,8-dihydro-6-hydroxymethylpterin-pyrophosphokinase